MEAINLSLIVFNPSVEALKVEIAPQISGLEWFHIFSYILGLIFQTN